jgi:hypothetical protein
VEKEEMECVCPEGAKVMLEVRRRRVKGHVWTRALGSSFSSTELRIYLRGRSYVSGGSRWKRWE